MIYQMVLELEIETETGARDRGGYFGIVSWTICKIWKIRFLTKVKGKKERYYQM